MPRVCTVCRHVDRELIDRQLVENRQTTRAIATQFGIHRSAILRHRTEHLPRMLSQAAERKGINRAQLLQDRIDSYIADLQRIRRKAERRGEYGQAISAVRELARLAGLEAGMLGLLRAPAGGSQTLIVQQASSGPVDHQEALRQARLLLECESDEAADRAALPAASPGVQVQEGRGP